MSEQFWKPEPREPWHDWRTWGMFVPLLASMLGFAFTGLFAFAFSDIGVIAGTTQSWMVIIGSALIVWGAEANTPFTVIEVFRKILRKEHNLWDISALVASLTGTAINLLVTFASRQTLFGDTGWRHWIMAAGPLISGIAVTLDYYGGMIELGFLFGSYEIRLTEYMQWKRASGQMVDAVDGMMVKIGEHFAPVFEQLTQRIDDLTQRRVWLTATASDVARLTAHLDGNRAGLTREGLDLILAEHKLNLPSNSTIKRGLRMKGDKS